MAATGSHGALLNLLSLLSSGRVTMSAGGSPFLSLRADERELEVEIAGLRESGIGISEIAERLGGHPGVLGSSVSAAASLSDLGWRLTLYGDGRKILTMGRGVSRLTGHVRVNPLGLVRLLAELR